MEHIAILSKKLRMLQKILSGEKTIESRWYVHKKVPYNCIKKGENIYFKESGEPVSVKAVVEKALFFDNLNDAKIMGILKVFGTGIGVSTSYAEKLKGKRFCTLVFINNVESINPFNINKKGYGLMAAWICIDDINRIRIP